jgi:hypothetical protein
MLPRSELPALADEATSVHVLIEIAEGFDTQSLHFGDDFTITLCLTADSTIVGVPRDAIRTGAPDIDLLHLGETSEDLLRGLLGERCDLDHVLIVRRISFDVILDLCVTDHV